MDGYEKLIHMMKNKDTSKNIFVTEMTSSDSCTVNGLPLNSDDLYITEHLTVKVVNEVVMNGEHAITVTYTEPLKKGDKVVVVKIDETKYAVLERVV